MAHRAREIGIHGKAQPRPVERAPEPAQLPEDRVAGFPPPLPHALDERLAAEGPPVDPLFGEMALHHHLRRDPGVIGARDPQHAELEHPLPARQIFDGAEAVPMWRRP